MKQYAHAKVNLYLEITGRTASGYHTLESLMCPIGIHDTLHYDFGAPSLSVTCSDPRIPQGEGNLAWEAAQRFFGAVGFRETVHIHIRKRIPAGAGLGGGSSDAACVLNGLNRHYGSRLDRDALLRLGSAIGADVPFFIEGRPAIASGIGDRLRPFTGLPPLPLLVVYPGRPLSTAAVYKKLNYGLTKKEKLNKHSTFREHGFRPERDLFNDLEVPAIAMEPEIAVVKAALRKHGAQGVLMSGSGSSVFGVFDSAATAARAKRSLSYRAGWQVMITELLVADNRGPRRWKRPGAQ